MPSHIQKGLATIGIGLLFAFVGLVWVANLFGVADEHARMISENPGSPREYGVEGSPAELRRHHRFKRKVNVGRFVFGGVLMLSGLITVVVGVRLLFTPSMG